LTEIVDKIADKNGITVLLLVIDFNIR